MTGNRVFHFVLVASVLFFLTLAPSPDVFALQCETKPMELAFDHASSVFLARIVSSEAIYSPDRKGSRRVKKMGREFEVIESFKGSVDYVSFDTELAWDTHAAHFAVGDVNLFFMDDAVPDFGSCTPKYLLGQEDTAIALQKLRDLKEGVFNTFSGAWATTAKDGHCSIYTTYLLEGSSSTLSFSIGHSAATEAVPATSNVWIYSYSKTGERTVDRSGLSLIYENGTTSIPFANSLLDNGANFYSKLDNLNLLLDAVLAQEPVYLEGSTRSSSPIEIPLALNGGSKVIKEFAHCGNLQLSTER